MIHTRPSSSGLMLACLAFLSLLPALSTAAAQSGTKAAEHGKTLAKAVKNLARQPDTAKRTWVKAALEKDKIPYVEQRFGAAKENHANILTAFGPEEGPAIVLCAHFDGARRQRNANGAFSGCVLLTDLAAELQKNAPEVRIIVCFFDQGSGSLDGSKAWLNANEGLIVRYALNVDHCGVGDAVMLGRSDRPEAQEARKALSKALPDLPCHGFSYAPPGDHRSFWSAGIGAVSMSFCPKREIEKATARFEGRRSRGPLPGVYSPRDKRAANPITMSRAAQALRAILTDQIRRRAPGLPLRPRFIQETREFGELLIENDLRKLVKEVPKKGHRVIFECCLRLLRSEEEDRAAAGRRGLTRLFSGELKAAAEKTAEAESLRKVYDQVRRSLVWSTDRHCFETPAKR